MNWIDTFLDRTTMYRLVLYYLVALLAAAFAASFFGLVPVDPTALAFTSVVIAAVAYASNRIFCLVFRTPANLESSWITALILILIMSPVTASDVTGLGGIVFVTVWAIASKFILAIYGKHLFNPAALGVALGALFLDQPATWWVGGAIVLLPLTLVGGILLVRKLRRADMVLAFIAANLLASLIGATPDTLNSTLVQTLTLSPLFFFAFVMLTEPLTAPSRPLPRIAFGTMVGVLAAPSIHFGDFYMTPELALLAGNLFAWLVSPKGRFALTLLRIEQAAAGAYDFIFSPDRAFAFEPGQYLEWTLAVPHADNRGNRRQFTIASAPDDDEVRLGVKFYPESSAFKRTLAAMQPGDHIHASQLSGNFVMPRDPNRKLAFIAGGIGMTPFRSMLQHLLNRHERRPIVVLYGNLAADDVAYGDVLDRAEDELGIRTVHVLEQGKPRDANTRTGRIDADLIRDEVPDFADRIFYVSGPRGMVTAVTQALHSLGVARSRVRTDFFAGFA